MQEIWAGHEAAGAYESSQYAEVADFSQCVNGTVVTGSDTFRCNNVSTQLVPHRQR